MFKYNKLSLLAIFEFSLRIYIAFYLLDYGIGKLTGNMFNNASKEMLNTPLKDVNLFYLTWYWFHRNILLTYFVGFCQIISAILLISRRTVLLGVLISLPIFINILLIDIYCVGMKELIVRVSLYIISIVFFVAYRKDIVYDAFKILTRKIKNIWAVPKTYLFLIPAFLIFFLIVEIILLKLI